MADVPTDEERRQLWDEALELNDFALIACGVDNNQVRVALEEQAALLKRMRDDPSTQVTHEPVHGKA